jgi:hypothetical protein
MKIRVQKKKYGYPSNQNYNTGICYEPDFRLTDSRTLKGRQRNFVHSTTGEEIRKLNLKRFTFGTDFVTASFLNST